MRGHCGKPGCPRVAVLGPGEATSLATAMGVVGVELGASFLPPGHSSLCHRVHSPAGSSLRVTRTLKLEIRARATLSNIALALTGVEPGHTLFTRLLRRFQASPIPVPSPGTHPSSLTQPHLTCPCFQEGLLLSSTSGAFNTQGTQAQEVAGAVDPER